MRVVAGVDLGGNAVNYTFLTSEEKFLIESLCEHPSRSKEGPSVCLQQILDGLEMAMGNAGLTLEDVAVVGLDTPGPASADGVLSAAELAAWSTAQASAGSPVREARQETTASMPGWRAMSPSTSGIVSRVSPPARISRPCWRRRGATSSRVPIRTYTAADRLSSVPTRSPTEPPVRRGEPRRNRDSGRFASLPSAPGVRKAVALRPRV